MATRGSGGILAAAAACVVIGASGCASLSAQRLAFPPQAARAAGTVVAGTPGAAPRVVDGRGELDARRAGQALAKLEREGPDGDLLARHLASMEAIGSAPLVAGNATRLLVDGPETYRAMFEAIGRARREVRLQTYIIEDDDTGRRLADLLVERRRDGVRVSLLYDAIGGIRTPEGYFERLREAGVAVCQSNPVNPLAGRGVSLNNRDHRKILVVDGRTAYTGGVNISDVYSSGSASARRRAERGGGWRDTHIEIRGPAAAELRRLFADSWARQDCPPQSEPAALAVPAREGDRVLRVLASAPGDAANPIRDELLGAMARAERSIHVTMAYFVPDPTTLDVLEAAARRGVDVQLVLPGFSDFWVVHAAGRSHYDRLLAAGVRIHERRDALLHAKTAVIDGVWSTVGSANMDWRSFLHNDEVNVVVVGEGFGREMTRLFEQDVAQSVQVTAADREARGIGERTREQLARLLEYWL